MPFKEGERVREAEAHGAPGAHRVGNRQAATPVLPDPVLDGLHRDTPRPRQLGVGDELVAGPLRTGSCVKNPAGQYPGRLIAPSSQARWTARYAVRRLHDTRSAISRTNSVTVSMSRPSLTNARSTPTTSLVSQDRGRPRSFVTARADQCPTLAVVRGRPAGDRPPNSSGHAAGDGSGGPSRSPDSSLRVARLTRPETLPRHTAQASGPLLFRCFLQGDHAERVRRALAPLLGTKAGHRGRRDGLACHWETRSTKGTSPEAPSPSAADSDRAPDLN
jgi:hypothetical protein